MPVGASYGQDGFAPTGHDLSKGQTPVSARHTLMYALKTRTLRLPCLVFTKLCLEFADAIP